MMQMLYPLYDVLSRLGKIVTRRAWPLRCHEDVAPFFIVGAGRSGTTLLRRMLVASGQVHIPPETYVLSQVIEHYRRNAYLDWPTLVNQCMALFELHPEFHTFQITLRPLLPALHALPEDERRLARILDMFYRFHARQTGVDCERWGDKTPINTFALDDIYAVFPKARFIHLLRDGVDVVSSFMDTGLMPRLEDAASHWKASIRAVNRFALKHPKQCLELRYECLISNTVEEIKNICEFLNLDYKETMIESLEHTQSMGDMQNYAHYKHANEGVTPKHIGKGRKSLSQEERLALQVALGSLLRELGYAPADREA